MGVGGGGVGYAVWGTRGWGKGCQVQNGGTVWGIGAVGCGVRHEGIEGLGQWIRGRELGVAASPSH